MGLKRHGLMEKNLKKMSFCVPMGGKVRFFFFLELMFVLFLSSISPFSLPAGVHSNKAWGDWIFPSYSSEYINPVSPVYSK